MSDDDDVIEVDNECQALPQNFKDFAMKFIAELEKECSKRDPNEKESELMALYRVDTLYELK
jgi:hypothetical protein